MNIPIVTRATRRIAIAATLLAAPLAAQTSASLSARLSEPGGYFDTDNLISNESSYLHAIDALRTLNVRGGAYIGVGPDQNFSYIAAIRPSVAFIIDIRRDNLLEQLMFKAIFELAPDRAQYLAFLTGRNAPSPAADWKNRSIDELVHWFDQAGPSAAAAENALAAVRTRMRSFGYDLSSQDMATIGRFHRAFIDGSLDLQFTSFNRRPQSYYPTLRRLFQEKNQRGTQVSFLAADSLYQVVRDLEVTDRLIPVVGDLGGQRALAAIGQEINRRGLKVSAFYTSNVEFYLMQSDAFARFARTAASLPYDDRSVIIRSYFGRFEPHPNAVPGYGSVQVVEKFGDFAREMRANGYRNYYDLVTKHVVPPVSNR